MSGRQSWQLIIAKRLATEIELLCQNIKAPSNTLFQIRKSSSSIYANLLGIANAFADKIDNNLSNIEIYLFKKY